MKKLLILTTFFLSIIIAQPGNSDVPSTISFQGLLTDAEGFNYVDGEYNLTFRLIRQIDETSEQNIWEESHLAFITNGIFSVNLGSLVALPLNITADTELETQVGEEVLSPRQSFNSVPFALKTSRAQQSYQSVFSDTAQFSLQASHSLLSDTAMFSLNAPMADTAQFSHLSNHANYADSSMYSFHSQHADTADLAIGLIGGIDNVQHATYADTAIYVQQAQISLLANEAIIANNSTYADTALYVQQAQTALIATTSENSISATYADTAIYVQQAQISLLANEAIIANNSTYADTALYVQQAQTALTATTSENSTNATYAETAGFIDLSQYSGEVIIHGSVVASSFSGDGSGLTGISSSGSLADLGITATADELNFIDGATSNIQDQLDSKTGITTEQATAIALNTAKVGITTDQASAIVTNTAKVGLTTDQVTLLNNTSGTNTGDQDISGITTNATDIATNVTAIALNTAKVGITTDQASAIVTNTAKVGLTNEQSTLLNNITSTSDELNLLDGVTATTAELNYTVGVTSAIQTQLDSKQAADDDLADLADGTLSASKVENAITTAGTSGQVWTSDGDGAGTWSTLSSGATSVNGLSDALVEDNSIYIGSIPSSPSFSNAQFNAGFGMNVMTQLTEGDYNSALGYWALGDITTGIYNAAFGWGTLRDITTGGYNTAIGADAANKATTGIYNIDIGALSGSNTTGSYNINIGMESGTDSNIGAGYETSGSYNIMIGSGSHPSTSNSDREIVLGNDAKGHGSNIAVIGSADLTAIHPGDDNGVDLGSSSYSYKNAHIDGTAYIGTVQTSSIVPTGIGEKYIEITIEGVYGAGNVTFDLDAALGSNNNWYKLEPLTITQWDGTQQYFNLQLDVMSEIGNSGDVSIDMQNNHSRPKFSDQDALIVYSSSGQHELNILCQGRSSTIKILFKVTSDWSS